MFNNNLKTMKFIKIFLITILMIVSFIAGMKFNDFKNGRFPKIIEDNIIVEEESTEPYNENNQSTKNEDNNKVNNSQNNETKELKSLENDPNADNIDIEESNIKNNIKNNPITNEEDAVDINEAEVEDNGGDTSIDDGIQSDEVESGTIKRGTTRDTNNR